jgi:hypothetical protein
VGPVHVGRYERGYELQRDPIGQGSRRVGIADRPMGVKYLVSLHSGYTSGHGLSIDGSENP